MLRKALAFSIFACGALISGCTVPITQSTFFPSAQLKAPNATLTVPAGYSSKNKIFDLEGLGQVRAVLLDNPQSNAVIIYSAGNGGFVDSTGTSRFAASLVALTSADVILYDYPGRGGTTIPATIEAAVASGPAILQQFKAAGWIGGGPVYAYGLSFGGGMAAAMARNGGFAGLIIEGSAADFAAIGRDFVPGPAKTFVKIKVADELKQFDYFGYTLSAKAPVLLLSGTADTIIRPKQMRNFADQLVAKGATVTFAPVPVGHGGALESAEGQSALRAFLKAQ